MMQMVTSTVTVFCIFVALLLLTSTNAETDARSRENRDSKGVCTPSEVTVREAILALKEVSERCLTIAELLKINRGSIGNIKKDCFDDNECRCRETIKKWYYGRVGASWDELVTVMKEMNEPNVVKYIEKKYLCVENLEDSKSYTFARDADRVTKNWHIRDDTNNNPGSLALKAASCESDGEQSTWYGADSIYSSGSRFEVSPAVEDPDPAWRVSVTEPPNLKLLVRFPEKESATHIKYWNLFEAIGIDSYKFGLFLLDPSGNHISNIHHKHSGNVEEANMEMTHEWLLGKGMKPVTWFKLIQVLNETKLTTLALMIQDSVSNHVMNMSSEVTHYSLETLEFIETIQNVYKKEDLLDPDLWLSQYLPKVGFINLTLEEGGRETSLHRLFQGLVSDSSKRVLFSGRPGVGKTTILRYVSKLWANGDLVMRNVCQVLIKIPLGNIDVPVLNDLTQLLKVAFRGSTITRIERLARDLQLNKGSGACLLLDAYDELKTDSTKKFIKEILENGVSELHLPKALHLVTSRSVTSNELKVVSDRIVEVVGIGETNLQLFFDGLDQDDQQSLKRFFKRQPNAFYLCQVPLYLSMVLFTVLGKDIVYDSSMSIDTETDLFTAFVSLTLEQYHKNRHPDWNRFSLWKCSFSDEAVDSEEQCEGFQALCSAAFQLVFRFRVSVMLDVAQGVLNILQKKFDLDSEVIEAAKEDLKLVLEIAKDTKESRDTIRFSFKDKSYEEFVNALHLAGLPDQETIELSNWVGKGKIIEEHICYGYNSICTAVNELIAQQTDGPPVNILDILQERSQDGRSFGYEPSITSTLKDLSLVKIIPRPTVYGEVLQFSFPHKTFQEFLCSLYMTNLPEHEQLTYVALYGKQEEYDLVFQFLFGLIKNSNTNASKLLQRYSFYKSVTQRGVSVLKIAKETKFEGKQFKELVQESGVLVNSSLCVRIKERDDCSSLRYTLKQLSVQKLGLHISLFDSSCLYFSVHSVKEVHLTVDCPSGISSFKHLKRRIAPVEKVLTHLVVKQCLLSVDDLLAFAEHLKLLSKLQTLHLVVTTDITVKGAETLSNALQALPNLNSLKLDMEVMCAGTQILIGRLAHLKLLRHLSLTLRSTDEDTLEMLNFRREHSCWKFGEDLQCPYQPFIDCFVFMVISFVTFNTEEKLLS